MVQVGGRDGPHDGVVRRVLGDPAHAVSLMRAVLPERLVTRLDLDRLVQAPADLIDRRLSKRYTDLLFSVPLDGRDAFVYLLLEHQSSTDRWMVLRMLEYVVGIWDQYVRHHPVAEELPAVIPLVLHYNTRPWNAPTSLTTAINLDPELDAELGDLLPRFRFLLDDLTTVDEHALRARPLTPAAQVTLWLLKTAPGNPTLDDDLAGWENQLVAIVNQPGGRDTLTTLITYIGRVAETPDDQLHKLFARLGPEAEEAYVTTAEMLIAKGHAKGRVEGRAETLLHQLAIKFGPVPPSVRDTVSIGTPEQLDTWTARILTADTINEIFR